MNIREVRRDDAAYLLAFLHGLDSETRFMMHEPGERTETVEEQTAIVEEFISNPAKVMLVAVEDGSPEIGGYVVGIGGEYARNRHSLWCAIGVRQASAGRGIGTRLLQSLESWARDRAFHRIELTVMEHNERAIALYTKRGFETEGIKRDYLRIDGAYVNELYMSKLL